MSPDPPITFPDFQPEAFVIRMMFWSAPTDYRDCLKLSDRVDLSNFRQLDQHGMRFSLPARIAQTSVEREPHTGNIRALPRNTDRTQS
jgi:hypothetical protein